MSPARRTEVDQPFETGLAGITTSPAGRELLEAIAASAGDGAGAVLYRTDTGTFTVGADDERAFSRVTIDHVADAGLVELTDSDDDGVGLGATLTDAGRLLLAE